ncbi:hypothetical protein N566_05640 [Streptomycetaceae bacterium MP113-05]|nr:hypothetical protein N566_05640 [Streptomycetaceae bacterium MP113-05]
MILRGTLGRIAGQVREAGVRRTAVTLVGRTLAARNLPDNHLCSPGRERDVCRPERPGETAWPLMAAGPSPVRRRKKGSGVRGLRE